MVKFFEQLKAVWLENERFYRLTAARSLRVEQANLDDFFLMIVFAELYGLENVYGYYTAELMPFLMPQYHDWHVKMGLKGDFFENLPCFCCVC